MYYNIVKRKVSDNSFVRITNTYTDTKVAIRRCNFKERFKLTRKYYYVVEVDFE